MPLRYHVIVAVGNERRVEVDQVNGLVRDVFPQNIQIIAVIKCVHMGVALRPAAIAVNELLCGAERCGGLFADAVDRIE